MFQLRFDLRVPPMANTTGHLIVFALGHVDADPTLITAWGLTPRFAVGVSSA